MNSEKRRRYLPPDETAALDAIAISDIMKSLADIMVSLADLATRGSFDYEIALTVDACGDPNNEVMFAFEPWRLKSEGEIPTPVFRRDAAHSIGMVCEFCAPDQFAEKIAALKAAAVLDASTLFNASAAHEAASKH